MEADNHARPGRGGRTCCANRAGQYPDRQGHVEHYQAAGDAIEALEKLFQEPYAVVLLDINMPEMSGTELVDQIRRREVPCPAWCLSPHDEHAIAAFERQAVDYALKTLSARESIAGR